ncbi:MAG: IPT/TIG domain-containing protein, partial [Phycisphaerales bacterium]|nr:IPT/TIG domain-containing protein [Phycisphaerales bacterium]
MAPLLDPTKIFFVPDGNSKNFPFLTAGGIPQIDKKVDILVEAHNQVGILTSAGAYRISYRVSNTVGGTVIPERTLAVFNQFPEPDEFSKFNIVYALGSELNKGLYVVTNAGNQAPSATNGLSNAIENAWFTNAKSGANDGAGPLAAGDLARSEVESKYPEGKYTVGVVVDSFNGGSLTREQVVNVRNWRPDTFETKIKAADGVLKKVLRWIWDAAEGVYKKSTPLDVSMGPGTYTIEVTFSEPMVNPTLSIDTFGDVPVTSSEPTDLQKTFSGTFEIGGNSPIQDGLRTVTISAQDLGGDQILQKGPSTESINPATQLARGADGVLAGVGGSDTSVIFNVDRTAPTVQVFDDDFRGVLDGVFTESGEILVGGNDTVEGIAGSGIARISLKKTSTDGEAFDESKDFPEPPSTQSPQEDSVNFPMAGGQLPEGQYLAEVQDQAGNNTELYFEIRAPLLIFSDDQGSGVTRSPTVNVWALGAGTGEGRSIVIHQLRGGSAFREVSLAAGQLDISIPADTPGIVLKDGDKWYVGAIDASRREVVSRHLYIDRTLPALSLLQADTGDEGVIGPLRGDQTGHFYWLNNILTDGFIKGIEFIPTDEEGGIARLKIERIGPEAEVYWNQTYNPGTRGEVFSIAALKDCPAVGDAACEGSYLATLSDHTDLTTKVAFKVDSAPPRIQDLKLLIGADLAMGLEGRYTDAGSGVYDVTVTSGPPLPQLRRDQPRPDGPADTTIIKPLLSAEGNAVADNVNLFISARDASGNTHDRTVVGFNRHVQHGQPVIQGMTKENVWYPFGGLTAPEESLGSILREFHSVNSPVPGNIRVFVRSKPRTSPAGDAVVEYEGGGDVPATLVYAASTNEEGVFSVTNACTDCPMSLGPRAEIMYQASGLPSQPNYDFTMLFATAAITYPSISLLSGLNVKTTLSGVEVEFADVAPGPENRIGIINGLVTLPPAGYRLLPGGIKPFDVFTNASYTGEVKVTVLPHVLGSPFPSSGLARLFHMENGVWVDRTTSYSLERGLTATQSSVSPFGVFISTSILPPDSVPPSTTLSFSGGSVGAEGAAGIISAKAPPELSATDDDSGVDKIYFAVDPSSGLVTGGLSSGTAPLFSVYQGRVPLSPGRHTVSYGAVDLGGNFEVLKTTDVLVDATAPQAVLVSSGAAYVIDAVDPVVDGFASGVDKIQYLIDADPETCDGVATDTAAPRGTCANLFYEGPFALSVGTHTVLFVVNDAVGNGEEAVFSSYVVVAAPAPPVVLIPSTGPIGVPFTISGSSFGAYEGSSTRVKFGIAVAPLSVWNDATITGTIPGLSTGVYAVTIERQSGSTVTAVSAGNFVVTDLSSATLNVSSGPIGAPFTFVGFGFGPYAGTLSRVLVDGATAPLSVWNNTTISGTIPSVSSGAKTIVIQREAGSVLSTSVDFDFEVLTDDASAPVLSLAPPDGSTVTTASPLIVASYFDLGRGIDAASVRLSLDGLDVSAQAVVTASSASYVPAPLSQGLHTIAAQVADLGGNSASSTATFLVDSLPPATTLLLNGLASSTTNLVVVSTDAFGFSAADSGTGVHETRFSIDGAADAVFLTPFSLAAGTHTLAFRSLDRVGHAEAVQTVSVSVSPYDDTAPITSLAVLGGRQFAGPNAASFYASSDTRFGLPAVDPLVDGVASGLALTQYQDNGGAFQVFASAFGLPEGAHLLAFQSRDNVQNLEVLRSTTALIDTTAPVSSATVASPRFVTADGTIYITPATSITLSADDPSLPTGQPGSGASRIEVAI